jgi:magnesium transporter
MEDVVKPRHLRTFKRLSKIGSEPGTLTVHQDTVQLEVKLLLTAFNTTELIELELSKPEDIIPYLQKYPMIWLSVYGLGDLAKLEIISSIFKLHSLAMEDVVNTHQRPKIEEYNDVMFCITRMPCFIDNQLDLEQISIFWSNNFVITFNERTGDYFESLRARVRKTSKRLNFMRSEYLAYAVVDTIVDSFFPILEIYGLRLDDIEENAIINPSRQIIINIHDYKNDLSALRRAMWSQREALRNFSEATKVSDAEMKFFIRDCEDHAIQLIDILESYRERTSGLMDIYLSAVNNRMNEIMKVLTIMATIFMPIGVVAGIYGMNFDRSHPWNMPELSWPYGYEYALSLMATIAIILLIYFKRRGWLHRKDFG